MTPIRDPYMGRSQDILRKANMKNLKNPDLYTGQKRMLSNLAVRKLILNHPNIQEIQAESDISDRCGAADRQAMPEIGPERSQRNFAV